MEGQQNTLASSSHAASCVVEVAMDLGGLCCTRQAGTWRAFPAFTTHDPDQIFIEFYSALQSSHGAIRRSLREIS
jgi:hypothetical protein